MPVAILLELALEDALFRQRPSSRRSRAWISAGFEARRRFFTSMDAPAILSANMRISARMTSGSSIAWSSYMTSTRRNTSFLCLETSLESTCSPRVMRSSRSINTFALSTRSPSDERTDSPSTLSLCESYCSCKVISPNRGFRPPSLHTLLKWSPTLPIVLQSTPSRLKTSVVIFPCPIRLPTPLKCGTLSLFRVEKASRKPSLCATKKVENGGV